MISIMTGSMGNSLPSAHASVFIMFLHVDLITYVISLSTFARTSSKIIYISISATTANDFNVFLCSIYNSVVNLISLIVCSLHISNRGTYFTA